MCNFMAYKKAAFILPLPYSIVKRIFLGNRDTIVSYSRVLQRLSPGKLLLIYASRPVSGIVGEAKIRTVEFLTPEEAQRKYGKRMILDPLELRDYMDPRGTVFVRGNKRASIIVVKDPNRYRTTVKLEKRMVPSGRFVDQKELSNIRNQGET